MHIAVEIKDSILKICIFKAYQRWVSSNGKEPLLPGLNYNQEQLFFIASGITWCSIIRDERLLMLLLNDVHTVPEFRVKGMTSNSDEFRKAFNCKAGQKNNPTKKCSVW